MIYPTHRTLWLLLGGVPLTLAIAVVAPQVWAIGLAWLAMVALVFLGDGWMAARPDGLTLEAPSAIEVGSVAPLVFRARFGGGRAPFQVQASLATDPRLVPNGRVDARLSPGPEIGAWTGRSEISPGRRGVSALERSWLRWTGPMGLAWRQDEAAPEQIIRVMPNIAALRSPTVQTFFRDSLYGIVARRMKGEGGEFEALADYQPGMDRRVIDWKGSARHTRLLAREYDTERNNPIVFAFDCGSTMCEPVEGQPRIDRAVSAGLMAAYIALKAGDRVSLFAFAARPALATSFMAHTRNFHRLAHEAAGIDYMHEEPNFTLALSTLTARLERRSLIVLFTDFHDPTSAELMLESVGRILNRHLLLFVTFADDELTEIANARPDTAERLAEAVIAAELMDQRRLVISRLRHMGANVIEARHDQIGPKLVDSYLEIKRRGVL